MKRIVAIIQARIGSTRLPRKVLLNLAGKTVLERVLERVKASKIPQKVIVATTINKDDLAIVEKCAKEGVNVFCGSEEDVLDRYYQAARAFGAEHIVRITADCPLIDPLVIDRVIRIHLSRRADYTSNTVTETFPDGEDVEVFTFTALKRAWENAKLLSEREHVTPYLRKKENGFKLASLSYKANLGDKRWTLDNPEDYIFIKKIYSSLILKKKIFGMKDILNYLSKNPSLERMNQHIRRNEGYVKSLRNDKQGNSFKGE